MAGMGYRQSREGSSGPFICAPPRPKGLVLCGRVVEYGPARMRMRRGGMGANVRRGLVAVVALIIVAGGAYGWQQQTQLTQVRADLAVRWRPHAGPSAKGSRSRVRGPTTGFGRSTSAPPKRSSDRSGKSSWSRDLADVIAVSLTVRRVRGDPEYAAAWHSVSPAKANCSPTWNTRSIPMTSRAWQAS